MSLISPPVAIDTLPDPESGATDAAKARKTAIATVIGSLVFAFLMIGMMMSVYIGTMHAPSPHDMPVAVIGSGTLAEDVVFALEKAEDSPASIQIVDSAAEAKQLLHDREISGAIELPADGSNETAATIYTASAAGASQASVVQKMLTPIALEAGLSVEVNELTPLPAGDSAGISVMFMAMGFMLAGYMPISLMLTGAPELLRLRRFVPIWAGWAALMSTLVWFIAGPLIGAVEGHTAALLGIGWLAIFSVGLMQLFISRLLGPAAVLIGMLLVIVMGMPASNLAMSVHTMPGFFGFLHGILPLAGAGEALRSVVYFGGDGVGGYLLRFVIAAVLAVLATAGFDLVRSKKKAAKDLAAANAADEAGTPIVEVVAAGPVRIPALPNGKPRSTPVRYLTLALFPFLMVSLMVGIMLAAMHSPSPVGVPVAVVSSTEGVAAQMAEGLEESMGDMLNISILSSAEEASDQVFEGDLVGAVVMPDATNPSATLYTAGAAGTAQQQVVQRVFQQVALQGGFDVEMVDVAPVADTDTNGAVMLYMAMGLVMSGFLGITVLAGGAPWALRLRRLVPILAAWAVVMSTVVWTIAGPLVGAYQGPAFAYLGIGILTIFSLGLVTAAFARLLGILAVIPVVTIFMFVGVPASGGGMSTYMQPGLFQTLQDVLPMPAVLMSVRSVTYFDGFGLGAFLLTIAIWGAAGLVANIIISLIQNARTARTSKHALGSGPAPGAAGGSTGEPPVTLDDELTQLDELNLVK